MRRVLAMTSGTELSDVNSAFELSRRGRYLRLVLCVLAIAVIHCFPLVTLRWLTSAEILQVSSLLGLPIHRAAETTLLYRGRIHEFTGACTFIDPLIISLILSWRAGWSALRNLRYFGLVVVFLASLNVVRIEANLVFIGLAFPAWVYHGISDEGFYFIAIVPGIRVFTGLE